MASTKVELLGLKNRALQSRARELGVADEQIDLLADGDLTKEQFVDLVVAHVVNAVSASVASEKRCFALKLRRYTIASKVGTWQPVDKEDQSYNVVAASLDGLKHGLVEALRKQQWEGPVPKGACRIPDSIVLSVLDTGTDCWIIPTILDQIPIVDGKSELRISSLCITYGPSGFRVM